MCVAIHLYIILPRFIIIDVFLLGLGIILSFWKDDRESSIVIISHDYVGFNRFTGIIIASTPMYGFKLVVVIVCSDIWGFRGINRLIGLFIDFATSNYPIRIANFDVYRLTVNALSNEKFSTLSLSFSFSIFHNNIGLVGYSS